MNSLTNLPTELVGSIFSITTEISIIHLRRTCHSFNKLIMATEDLVKKVQFARFFCPEMDDDIVLSNALILYRQLDEGRFYISEAIYLAKIKKRDMPNSDIESVSKIIALTLKEIVRLNLTHEKKFYIWERGFLTYIPAYKLAKSLFEKQKYVEDPNVAFFAQELLKTKKDYPLTYKKYNPLYQGADSKSPNVGGCINHDIEEAIFTIKDDPFGPKWS